MVRGFDIENLQELGDGQFAVKGTYRGGGSFRDPGGYCLVELHIAGLIPPEEVTDLWVPEDA